jgi:hypothetical protein
VSYSEFKAFVKKGKIANLTLGKETISGTLSTDGLADGTDGPGDVGPERNRAGNRAVMPRTEDRRQEVVRTSVALPGAGSMMCCAVRRKKRGVSSFAARLGRS